MRIHIISNSPITLAKLLKCIYDKYMKDVYHTDIKIMNLLLTKPDHFCAG